jgi:hypothetical protein
MPLPSKNIEPGSPLFGEERQLGSKSTDLLVVPALLLLAIPASIFCGTVVCWEKFFGRRRQKDQDADMRLSQDWRTR